MKPTQKIKRSILQQAINGGDVFAMAGELTADSVDAAYDVFVESDAHWDYESEYRERGIETNIECDYSRHYEAKSVATRTCDGSWVGWTYWYGGGKHGNPEEINWMEDAYDLECSERQETVTVREFTRMDHEEKSFNKENA